MKIQQRQSFARHFSYSNKKHLCNRVIYHNCRMNICWWKRIASKRKRFRHASLKLVLWTPKLCSSDFLSQLKAAENVGNKTFFWEFWAALFQRSFVVSKASFGAHIKGMHSRSSCYTPTFYVCTQSPNIWIPPFIDKGVQTNEQKTTSCVGVALNLVIKVPFINTWSYTG